MFKNGIVIGKFAPLTRGHINLINLAACQCEHLKVIISYDQRWVDKQNNRDRKRLGLKNRKKWLMYTYNEIKHISVHVIDETSIPEYPHGRQEFAELIRPFIDENCAIFSGEPEELDYIKQYIPEITPVVVDSQRTRVPISANMVRKNIYKYWDYIPSIVRKDYTISVCLIGQESTGKSTMAMMLGKLFNTSWTEEYGRTYSERVLFGDESLYESYDYAKIAYRNKELEEEALKHANKIVFIDTNAFITEYYHRLYEGYSNPIVSAIAHNENYDYVIYLAPTVKWVDDGLRVNSDRSKTTPLFNALLAEYPNQLPEGRTLYIDAKSYLERFNQAAQFADKILNTFNQGEY
ncbi:multifunctional transcriptional regulator/nicotinamide-nucleotide adenylyltransferase/ribosylnicotinamide kinase NadR [Candidatus Schmidhempelia bombi]|jgi:HTH-type transcriptional regulator, transcriptional repressor of NAD biosynthesis genes|uniref:Multifunctional transcriptional regulator/nicotinamide-nucleotide adenylyltransferase/ribosylnicotinamide kinase NadR n=1 Tax=Candidatus Schmidhempelia bombi str. Bimp TaxID=1387197 RepID=A0AB94ICW7_9GAMM|nr:multifunctional transcriptional regulator/nicotinamide-nucleotide adenylyltransferase/ribosylnicotinamide kinase NadR [Candidatus Schmidhempelia bombi]TEA27267.1 multifunctional transcriptional regulator/nicotinamide-nucleotide adenylyltransferase/ribosylnicotinamide kinase NadR [Candidatus Schmidhempelia bombi str. Bimp]